MIEVPAAALVADGLAEVADFFSIGTNDLVQYTLAADRVNPALAELATALQPAVLRLIGAVVDSARARGRHVAVCGEAAADLEMVPLLVGLGVDELSVAPSSVAAVAAHLAGLRMAACRDLARDAIAATTVAQVRERAQGRLARDGRARLIAGESSAPGSDDPGAGISLERAGDPRRVRWSGRHRLAWSSRPLMAPGCHGVPSIGRR